MPPAQVGSFGWGDCQASRSHLLPFLPITFFQAVPPSDRPELEHASLAGPEDENRNTVRGEGGLFLNSHAQVAPVARCDGLAEQGKVLLAVAEGRAGPHLGLHLAAARRASCGDHASPPDAGTNSSRSCSREWLLAAATTTHHARFVGSGGLGHSQIRFNSRRRLAVAGTAATTRRPDLRCTVEKTWESDEKAGGWLQGPKNIGQRQEPGRKVGSMTTTSMRIPKRKERTTWAPSVVEIRKRKD